MIIMDAEKVCVTVCVCVCVCVSQSVSQCELVSSLMMSSRPCQVHEKKKIAFFEKNV